MRELFLKSFQIQFAHARIRTCVVKTQVYNANHYTTSAFLNLLSRFIKCIRTFFKRMLYRVYLWMYRRSASEIWHSDCLYVVLISCICDFVKFAFPNLIIPC